MVKEAYLKERKVSWGEKQILSTKNSDNLFQRNDAELAKVGSSHARSSARCVSMKIEGLHKVAWQWRVDRVSVFGEGQEREETYKNFMFNPVLRMYGKSQSYISEDEIKN